MPKIGTNTATKNGKRYFGDKNADYLEKKSREAVEDYNDFPILYFQIDWAKSQKNFYGEMKIKKFVNPKGIEVRGVYKITQGDENTWQGIPNKIMKMTVSVYVEQLEELGITPDRGDYFGVGKRLYYIFDKTIEDVGPGQLMMNRKRMRQDFLCVQDDDEVLQKDAFGANLGLETDINPGNSNV